MNTKQNILCKVYLILKFYFLPFLFFSLVAIKTYHSIYVQNAICRTAPWTATRYALEIHILIF